MEVLGIDIGGSGIKGAMVNVYRGELVTERIRIETPQPASPKAVIATIAELVSAFNYQGPLGVGFPAVVLDGVVMSAANIDKAWIGYAGQETMADATGCDVYLVNDADAAGVSEMRLGAGRKRSGLVMIFTLGTGIGSAMFINGRLVPNTELGHVYLPGHQEDAERYAASRVRKAEGLKWGEWADRVNEYLCHMERLFSPNLMIIGGGVSKKHGKFMHHITVKAEVMPASLRNEAGIIGAAMWAAEESGNLS